METMASDGRGGLAARAGLVTVFALLAAELVTDFAGTELAGPFAAGLVVYVLLYGLDETPA